MLVRVKATGQVLDLVGVRLAPMLASGMVEKVDAPVREVAAIPRAIQTAARFITSPLRKLDALARR